MRVILRKAAMILGKKRAVGTVIVVTLEKANELGTSAEEYKGAFPPKKKHKIDLSHLKTK